MSSTAAARDLKLAFSPCPNDTFMFHALVHGLVPTPGVRWQVDLHDIEALNQLAFAEDVDVTKISFHAYGKLRERYALLASGAALGRGCGPLVVASRPDVSLADARIAIPGADTSAALLLRLYAPELAPEQLVTMRFDRILAACASGAVDAGLIIHESRFTYRDHGLTSLLDLGDWWEGEFSCPIPLGGIIVHRRVPLAVQRAIEAALRRSVVRARADPEASRSYVEEHAQEIAPEVQRAHIDLYVNDYSVDLGLGGTAAVRALFRAAEARGVLPAYDGPMMVGDARD